MAELDYSTTHLGIQGKRTGSLSYDGLFSQRMVLLFAAQKKQLFFEQKICMKSNEILRQNNAAKITLRY